MNGDVFRQYLNLHNALQKLQKEASEAEKELSVVYQKAETQLASTRSTYECAIAPIDKQIEEIKIYLSEAKRYVNSAGYRPQPVESHTARLQQLFTILGRNPAGMQAAEELFRRSMDMICFFERKKEQAGQTYENEKKQVHQRIEAGEEASLIKQRLASARQQITALVSGEEMQQLAKDIASINHSQSVQPGMRYMLQIPETDAPQLCVGSMMLPFQVEGDDVKHLVNILGKCYSQEQHSIYIPASFSSNDSHEGMHAAARVSVAINGQTASQTSAIIRMILFNILRSYVPKSKRVYLLDFESFNTEHLGCLREFVGNEKLVAFPANEKAVTKELSGLEADINSEKESVRPRRFLIIRGTPTGDCVSKLKLICSNSKAYNLSVILIERDQNFSAIFQKLDSVSVITSENNRFFTEVDGVPAQFVWFSSPNSIEDKSAKALIEAYKPHALNNEYSSVAPFPQMPKYTRERRPISVPYGISSDKKLVDLTFEGMDFAAFFMGASGSGKSTLLHSIIAGIVRNYHPDEVELWLVDLKLMEFANYMHHIPPHVKFILMDSAPELIFDFIDRLYEEMTRRETLIASCHCSDRKDVPESVYLPAAFVIIDEFSVLSDVVKNNETYKEKIQQLLVKGRAAGLRFIFSSQKFTGGTAALTATAHDQIGLRIAMKHPLISEIKDTLSIPGGQYTDEMLNAVETLPAYHTLRRLQHRDGSHSLEKAVGLYFKGIGEAAWNERYAFFDRLNQEMKPVPVDKYDPQNTSTFVEKHPIIVSGNDLSVFSPENFKKSISYITSNPPDDYDEDNLLISLGVPRKLQNDLFAALTPDWKENILLYAGNEERSCAASVIQTVAESFRVQGLRVQLWAHPKNLLYKKYRDTVFAKMTSYVGAKEVGTAIEAEVDRIRSGSAERNLIIVLGADRLCADFEASDNVGFFAERASSATVDISSLVAKTPEEQALAAAADEDERILAQMQDEFYEREEASGKTEEQLDAEFEEIAAKYYEEKYNGAWTITATTPAPQEPEKNDVKISGRELVRYLQALLDEGSAYGTHILLAINNMQSLSRARIKTDLFNHRIAFRTDSPDTSVALVNNSSAFRLVGHAFRYAVFGSGNGSYALKPYLHADICWDGWRVNENNQAIGPNHIS